MIGKNGVEYIRLSINATQNPGSARYFVGLGDRRVQGEYDVPNHETFSCFIEIDRILKAIAEEKKRDGVE